MDALPSVVQVDQAKYIFIVEGELDEAACRAAAIVWVEYSPTSFYPMHPVKDPVVFKIADVPAAPRDDQDEDAIASPTHDARGDAAESRAVFRPRIHTDPAKVPHGPQLSTSISSPPTTTTKRSFSRSMAPLNSKIS